MTDSAKKNQLQALLSQTVETVTSSKKQAYSIYENNCKEVEEQEKQIREIKKKLRILQDEVDRACRELQLRRQGLVSASKKFSEQDMHDQLAEVSTQQNELQKLMREEAALRQQRDDMEIRLRRLIEMKQETEELVIAIGSVCAFLNNKVSKSIKETSALHFSVEVGEQIIIAQEEERRRLSIELHDNVAQDLAKLKMDLALSTDLFDRGKDDKAKPIIYEAKTCAAKCLVNARQAIFDIHPMEIDDVGFIAATKQLCQDFMSRGLLKIKFESVGEESNFPKVTVGAIYRIVQEALNNVVKHSGQRKADVKIHYTPSHLVVVVSDKGKGFEASENISLENSAEARHYGLAGMMERARHAGAQIEVTPKLGEGVTVRVSVKKP